MNATTGHKPPIAALAVAGYGAVLGSLFPVVAVLSSADISGGLSVAADSGALVNTFQNVGAIAGVLATPALAFGMGRGRAMEMIAAGFVGASALCALAPDLPLMVCARVVQGFFAGAMPLLFMLLVMTSLPPGRGRFEGMTLFATSTSLLFGLAATAGGSLVDGFGWRSLFWAQAFLGVPYWLCARTTLREELGKPEALIRADWGSYSLLAIGLAAILVAASEGERHFWLATWWVPTLAVAGATLVACAIAGLARSARPLLLLSVFRRPTFTWGIVLSVFFRFGQMFAIYIVPSYLGRLQGYRTAEIGAVLAPMTPAAALSLLASYVFARRFDSRWLLSAGLASFACAASMCIGLTPEWAADQLRLAAAVAGLGMGFFSVAVLRFATHGVTMQDGPTVGIIFNLTRVFGIVAGLAILSHLVVEREKFHSARIVEAVSATSPETSQRIAQASGAFARFSADAGNAQASAIATLSRAAGGQAFTLAFADAFVVTAIVLALGAVLVWALPAVPPEAATTSTSDQQRIAA
ncbi:MFS transporter [Sphingomonas sp. BK235]|uniref:MFS transporter n=1 Tax=Sphingomonas sp. BK235 TaxID=2512131 RepID=UPI0010DC4317|nr:MFS transporter [Sphingomonas sp. BK235]TCP36053.1 DHA2 family multidrug resistance protein [Sphingomonas sp. BK235]